MTIGVRRRLPNISHTFTGDSVVNTMWRNRFTVITALSTDSRRVVGWGQQPLRASLLAPRRGYIPVKPRLTEGEPGTKDGESGTHGKARSPTQQCHFHPPLRVFGEQRHRRHTGLSTTQPSHHRHLCRFRLIIFDARTSCGSSRLQRLVLSPSSPSSCSFHLVIISSTMAQAARSNDDGHQWPARPTGRADVGRGTPTAPRPARRKAWRTAGWARHRQAGGWRPQSRQRQKQKQRRRIAARG